MQVLLQRQAKDNNKRSIIVIITNIIESLLSRKERLIFEVNDQLQ